MQSKYMQHANEQLFFRELEKDAKKLKKVLMYFMFRLSFYMLEENFCQTKVRVYFG